MRIVITIVVAMLCACTAPNPVAHVEADTDGAAFVDGVDAADDVNHGAVTDGGHPEDVDDGGRIETDDPETCDGVSERPEVPTCHGGTLEIATDGAIVCHWSCVGLVEVTAVAVETAPGCFALDDMLCHQCTERLPSSREPAPMPCPDVVRLLW